MLIYIIRSRVVPCMDNFQCPHCKYRRFFFRMVWNHCIEDAEAHCFCHVQIRSVCLLIVVEKTHQSEYLVTNLCIAEIQPLEVAQQSTILVLTSFGDSAVLETSWMIMTTKIYILPSLCNPRTSVSWTQQYGLLQSLSVTSITAWRTVSTQ